MPTENVLVQITTAANLAGIEAAKTSLLGLQATTIGLTVALGAIVFTGKAAIENAKKQEEAFDQLTQAYQTQGQTLDANKERIRAYISENASFIKNQYDTEEAMAAVLRAGYGNDEMFRILSDALDMAAINHSDVSEEAQKLVIVLAGGAKTLKQYGITADEYNKIVKDDTLPLAEKHRRILELIESHTKGAKEQTDALEASQNRLNIAWENFTGKQGGPILTILEGINNALTTGVQLLDLYVQLLERLTKLEPGNLLKIAQIINFINDPGGALSAIMKLNASAGRAAVSTADVGHARGERLTGPQLDQLSNDVAQRLRMVRGY